MANKQIFADRLHRISSAAQHTTPAALRPAPPRTSRFVMPVMVLLSMAGGTVFAWEMMEYKARTAPQAPGQTVGMTLPD